MNKTAFSEMLGGISALYPKVAFKECDSVEEIDNYTSRVGGFIAGLGISKFDPNKKKITYTFLYNESVPGSAVQIQNLMDTALLRYTDNTSGGRIDVWSHAIGPGLNTIMADETTMGTNFIVFVLLGLLISSALGVQRLVYEKECMFKPQLFIAGMRPLVYCTGNILSLSLPILVSSVLIAALSAAIGINGTTGEMFVPLLLTLVVFSFSLSSFNYLFSKIFKKSEDCVSK